MGPILILDKSAFQMFSMREHSVLDRCFYPNLTPVLVLELLGDLAKQMSKGRTAETVVKQLAQKFFGSGPVVNADCNPLTIASLMGVAEVPMTGQIVVDNARPVQNSQLGIGMWIDLSAYNHAILRWARGEFSDFEKLHATLYRAVTAAPTFRMLWGSIEQHQIVIPRPRSIEELGQVIRTLADEPGLQDAWLDVLLSHVPLTAGVSNAIRQRWSPSNSPLRTFAPYAHYRLKVWIAMVAAVHHGFLKWEPTHLIDMQYLNYLPFCMVFSSEDRVHRLLAPLLKRDDQVFLAGRDLKAALRAEADAWDAMENDARGRLGWALSGCPLPHRDSLLFQTYAQFCNTEPGGNRICHLSDAERTRALEEATALLREA